MNFIGIGRMGREIGRQMSRDTWEVQYAKQLGGYGRTSRGYEKSQSYHVNANSKKLHLYLSVKADLDNYSA